MPKFDFSSYLSPFTWRYGSPKMRKIFSEEYKYQLWRKIWIALAEAQFKAGLLTKKELDDLVKNQNNLDIDEILSLEEQTKHDVVAAIKEFAGKAKVGGGKIHLGATSMDIVDNADAIRIKEALVIIEEKLKKTLSLFAKKIEKYAKVSCLGYTHLQPAEPTTVGYRLSFYAQDLLTDYEFLQFVKKIFKGKGMKGAVGTGASYDQILNQVQNDKKARMTFSQLEKEVSQKLGIDFSLISSQVYSRKFDYLVLSVLNSIASSLSKFAADLRILQSPAIGEWAEPFGDKQVGSSAMPFKKNPINSEKICSLARLVNALPQVILENASLSYLERTLDDSANKRVIIPEAFLAVDEILQTAEKLVEGLVINEKKIKFNLSQYAPFAANEPILTGAVVHGANRQAIHEVLRQVSLKAWAEVQGGKDNPMEDLLMKDKTLTKYLSKEKIKKLLDVSSHIGDAPDRALLLVKKIKEIVK